MTDISIDLIARIAELCASIGLIATCLLLFRFFRGGIMEYPFAMFTFGSFFFFLGVLIATLIESGSLPDYPYDAIHLLLEILFVIILLLGLLLLYRGWTSQHRVPEY